MSAAVAAETARQILAVAIELFGVRGYAEVALGDVARAAGVTRGAVYHHYGSKGGLFLAVVRCLHGRVGETVGATPLDDPVAGLRRGSHAFLDAITDPAVARVLLVDGPAVVGWDAWRELDAEGSGGHLREALAAAGVDAALLDALAAQLSGAMNEAALWLAARPGDGAAREAAHRALDRLLDAAVPSTSTRSAGGEQVS